MQTPEVQVTTYLQLRIDLNAAALQRLMVTGQTSTVECSRQIAGHYADPGVAKLYQVGGDLVGYGNVVDGNAIDGNIGQIRVD